MFGGFGRIPVSILLLKTPVLLIQQCVCFIVWPGVDLVSTRRHHNEDQESDYFHSGRVHYSHHSALKGVPVTFTWLPEKNLSSAAFASSWSVC